jgi:hypothetical protein
MDPEELYTIKRIVQLTGRHPALIRRWIASGDVPSTKDTEWPHRRLVRLVDVIAIAHKPRGKGTKKTQVDIIQNNRVIGGGTSWREKG